MYERYEPEADDGDNTLFQPDSPPTPLFTKYLLPSRPACGDSPAACHATRQAGRCPVEFPAGRNHRTDATFGMDDTLPLGPPRCAYPQSFVAVLLAAVGVDPYVPDSADADQCRHVAQVLTEAFDLWASLTGEHTLLRRGVDVAGDIRYLIWWLNHVAEHGGYGSAMFDLDPF